MSDSKNRDDNLQDYLNLLDEYANKELKENADSDEEQKTEIKEEIDESFYNQESVENAENTDENLSDRINLGVFDEEKSSFRRKKASPPPMISKNKGEKEKNPFKRIAKWFKKLSKPKKVIVSILAIFLAIIIAFLAAGGAFIIKKVSLLGDALNKTGTEDVIYDDVEPEDIVTDFGSAGFQQSLKDWATVGNDKHMSSKNVINVLLIGVDSRTGSNTGNTDVMMLLSLNKKTKELKMVSFLRDSYLYVEGNNGSYCTKLNAAYSMGGPEVLMKTLENNYKIDIDNYVLVNFESFKAIIDAMGGIQVDVQEYEAAYNYKRFKVELPVGEGVTLNGEQALCFCRIRGCDSDGDVSRTRRQRQVIDSIVSRVKEASISDLNKYIDILLPYIETGYSESEILSLGIKAITNGWANYERTQLQMPPEDCRTSGSANMWIWVVDYELAAHKLQMEIYGNSNITIREDRTSIIDVYRGANYSGTGNSGNTDSGNNVPKTTVPVITTESSIPTDVDVTLNNIIPTETQNSDVTDNTDVIESETNPVEDTIPDTVPSGDDTGETEAEGENNPPVSEEGEVG